jgi:hypothetical protein
MQPRHVPTAATESSQSSGAPSAMRPMQLGIRTTTWVASSAVIISYCLSHVTAAALAAASAETVPGDGTVGCTARCARHKPGAAGSSHSQHLRQEHVSACPKVSTSPGSASLPLCLHHCTMYCCSASFAVLGCIICSCARPCGGAIQHAVQTDCAGYGVPCRCITSCQQASGVLPAAPVCGWCSPQAVHAHTSVCPVK